MPELFMDPNILSAAEDEVILQVVDYDGHPEGRTAVVHMTRELYHAIIDRWLDGKAQYYAAVDPITGKRGTYAGAGTVQLTGAVEIPGGAYIRGPEDHPVEVPTMRVTGFEIDMEHG